MNDLTSKPQDAGGRGGAGRQRLSIVIPVYNEAEVLPELHQRLAAVLDSLPYDAEIIYVDDGSRDASCAAVDSLRATDPRVVLLRLSRNFGKEVAMTAGLDHATGDAVIVIDADLQDPPELIPELVRPWAEGRAEVVNAQRRSRAGHSWLKRTSAHTFYRVMERVGRAPMPRDVGDFRLLSRRAVESLKNLREQHRFMKGLFAWIGYPQITVPYDRDPRFAGRTKWNYYKLWNFSIEGVTAFTSAPLKVATYLGLVAALIAFGYGCTIIFGTLVYGSDVPGYPSLMVVVLFLGGIQLITIGILGEYVGRISDEVKGRPLYLVRERHGAQAPGARQAKEPPPQQESAKKAARKAPEIAPRAATARVAKKSSGKASGSR